MAVFGITPKSRLAPPQSFKRPEFNRLAKRRVKGFLFDKQKGYKQLFEIIN